MGDENLFDIGSEEEADFLSLDINIDTPQLGLNHNGKREAPTPPLIETKIPRLDETKHSPHLAIANRVLRERFGLDHFRLKQAEAICRLLDGDSTVVVFPTGGGKSLCYQVPALCFKALDRLRGQRSDVVPGGITLVVSPLIALMKDQVDALRRRGISAAAIDSSRSREDYIATMDSIRNGTLDILYCAPERLNNEGFVSNIASINGGVRLLAVDEAHCISEWGHAFRPDYLKIARFATEIKAERVVCLTATATPDVALDVCRSFNVDEAGLFRTTTYRPNLRLEAKSFQTKHESYPYLTAFLKAHPGPTIVYVTAQRDTNEVAKKLNQSGLKARPFHAGMKPHDKTMVQDQFMKSDQLIIVATIAFGMGIDKANIRNVVHYALPRSLEGYSQEIGRAGRDGRQSHCILFLCAEDLHTHESFARGDLPSRQSVRKLLKTIFATKPDDASMIEASHHGLSHDCDIRSTVLGNIFAQLELRFHLLRAATPKYTEYSFRELRSLAHDKSLVAAAIRIRATKKVKFFYVDVEKAGKHNNVGRSEVISKLNSWNEDGTIELKTSSMMHVYRLHADEWPPSQEQQNEILDQIYQQLQEREIKDLLRMASVRDLITGHVCFARTLAGHFGDVIPTPSGDCGHCTWCETGQAVPPVKAPSRAWDAAAWQSVLNEVPDRDDARYLARVAYGITSPRATTERMTKNAVFGSMCDQDFQASHAMVQEVY